MYAGDQLPETTCEVQFLSSNNWSARLVTIVTCIVAFYAPVTAMSVLYALVYAHTRRRTRGLQSLCAATANSMRSTATHSPPPTAAEAAGPGGHANANASENGNGRGITVPADGVVIENANSIPHSSGTLVGYSSKSTRLRKKSSTGSSSSHRDASRTSSSNRYNASLPQAEEVERKPTRFDSSVFASSVARARNWYQNLCLSWGSFSGAPHQSVHTESETLAIDGQIDADAAGGRQASGGPPRDIPLVLMNTRPGALTAFVPNSAAVNGEETGVFERKRSGCRPLIISNSRTQHKELCFATSLPDGPPVRRRKLSWRDDLSSERAAAGSAPAFELCADSLVRENSRRSHLSVLSDESVWVDGEQSCHSPTSLKGERKSLVEEDTFEEGTFGKPLFRDTDAVVGGREVIDLSCSTPTFVTACSSLDVLHSQNDSVRLVDEKHSFAHPPNTLLSPMAMRTPQHAVHQQHTQRPARAVSCATAADFSSPFLPPSPFHLLSPPISSGVCSISSPSTVKSVLSVSTSCKSCSSSTTGCSANPTTGVQPSQPTSDAQDNAGDAAHICNRTERSPISGHTQTSGMSLRPPLPKQNSSCLSLQLPAQQTRRTSLNVLFLPPLLQHGDSMRSRGNSQSASQAIIGGGGMGAMHGRVSTVSTSATARLEKGERKAMKTLLAILAAFIITWWAHQTSNCTHTHTIYYGLINDYL